MKSASLFRAVLAIAISVAPASAQTPAGAVTPPVGVETLIVDRDADDDAPGTLRWAITRANLRPGGYRISIVSPPGAPVRHIRLRGALPQVMGPVEIEGAARARDGRHAIIDGSAYLARDLRSCPGLVPGQYGTNVRTTSNPGLAIVDTRGVAVRGVEVRGFCIGILVMRSSNVTIEDSRIVGNMGGAGIMFSGDDGRGGATATTTVDNKALRNVFIGNGDGLELTRGAAYTLVADNVFEAGADNLEPSQGIEILWGNDNVILRNRFSDYSDGVQINWGARNHIAANRFTGNAVAISATGTGNVIDGNEIVGNGVGVGVRRETGAGGTRITENRIADNGLPIMRCRTGGNCDPALARGGIVIGLPGPEHPTYVGPRGMGVVFDPAAAPRACTPTDQPAGCQPVPQRAMQPPVIDTLRRDGAMLRVAGRATGPAETLLTLEFFGGTRATDAGGTFLGTVTVPTDATGVARYDGTIAAPEAAAAFVVATSTDPQGATSTFSAAAAGPDAPAGEARRGSGV